MCETIIKHYNENFDSIRNSYCRASRVSNVENVISVNCLLIDEQQQTIKFEYYKEYITLRRWINTILITRNESFSNAEKTVNRIGVFIAEYHNMDLGTKTQNKWLKEEIDIVPCDKRSFLHGDLTDNNILINQDGEVVVIDWESAPVVSGFFDYGNSLWDVVWFANALLRPSPLSFFSTNKRLRLVKQFILGYNTVSKIDLESFFQYYDNNVKNLIRKIHCNSSIYHQVLFKKHLDNWKYCKAKLSELLYKTKSRNGE